MPKMSALGVRLLLFIAGCFSVFSCTTQNFGQKFEFHDAPDSAKSVAQKKYVRNLPFDGFKPNKIVFAEKEIQYRLLSPENPVAGKKYPLVIVFHGSGAIGNDNVSQMGILSKIWLLPNNRKDFPAYILAPQFPVRSSNYHEDSTRGVQVSESNEYLDVFLNFAEDFAGTNNVDKDRIYVTGFSMGGSTVMNALSARPELFVAAVNVSGISQFDKISVLRKIPLLIVHGSLDTDNRPESNRKFFEETKKDGKVIFWEFKDKYHNNILAPELTDHIPQWLFKFKKNDR